MDEAQIAAQQRANIPSENTIDAPKVTEVSVNTDQATIQAAQEIDSMTAYKLANILGTSYNPTDTETNSRLQFIYGKAMEITGSTDYVEVAQYIKELYSMLGLRSANDPLFNMYNWLRLDNIRRRAESEMRLHATGW